MTVRSLRRALVIAAIATAVTAPLAFAQQGSADLAVSKSGPTEATADRDVSYRR